jgi:hypothetical protein
VAATLGAASAGAQADRDRSTLCPNVCPAGDGTFVTLRDGNGDPVPGITVTLDYSNPVVKNALAWCEVPPETLYTAVTGGDGKAAFPVEAGNHAPSGVVTLLFGVPWDPDEPSPGFDLNGDRVVDDADETIILGAFGTPNDAADYNCDDLVNLADYAVWVQHEGHACQGGGTGAVPLPPGRLLGLGPIYPNPSASRVAVAYSLARSGWVRLSVFDVSGRLVARLVEGMEDAGGHAVAWDGRAADGRQAASGLYCARLESSGQVESRWIVIAR